MALLRHLATRKVVPIQPALFYNVSRQAAGRILDHMPGPYPQTEKERLAAAKKYGLLPEEYKPIADDGFGRGDYPDLPHIGQDSRDPNYPWDYPEFKKNYGEPWHIDSDIYGEDRLDPAKDWRLSKTAMMTWLLGTVGGLALFAYLTSPFNMHRPACKKQFPREGKPVYSFERGQ